MPKGEEEGGGGFDNFLIYEGLGKKEGELVFLKLGWYLSAHTDTYTHTRTHTHTHTHTHTSVSPRIVGTWGKFRELSGILVRK